MVVKTYVPVSRIIVRLTNNPRRDNRDPGHGRREDPEGRPPAAGEGRAGVRRREGLPDRGQLPPPPQDRGVQGLPPLFRAGGRRPSGATSASSSSSSSSPPGERSNVRDLRRRDPRRRPSRDPRAPGGHVPDHRPPRPRRRGHPHRGRGRARDAAAEHHRPRRRPPAPGQRGRDALGGLQRRGLQFPRAPGGARGARPHVPDPDRYRGRAPRLRGMGGRRSSTGSGACSSTAIWDRPRRRLVLVRDRLGIKPLYYTLLADGTLVFGSELKAVIAHPGVRRELEPQALDLFLTLEYVPAPWSIFKGIKKLPAGHRLALPGRQDQHQEVLGPADPKEAGAPVETEGPAGGLRRALRPAQGIGEAPPHQRRAPRRLPERRDRLLDHRRPDARARAPRRSRRSPSASRTPPTTSSSTPGGSPACSRRNTRSSSSSPRPSSSPETLVRHLDEPFGDFSIFPTYLVSKMARAPRHRRPLRRRGRRGLRRLRDLPGPEALAAPSGRPARTGRGGGRPKTASRRRRRRGRGTSSGASSRRSTTRRPCGISAG